MKHDPRKQDAEKEKHASGVTSPSSQPATTHKNDAAIPLVHSQLPEDDEAWGIEFEPTKKKEENTPPPELVALYELEPADDEQPEKPKEAPKKPWTLMDPVIQEQTPRTSGKEGMQRIFIQDEPEAPEEPEAPIEVAPPETHEKEQEEEEENTDVLRFMPRAVVEQEPQADLVTEALETDAETETDDVIVMKVERTFPNAEVPLLAQWDTSHRVQVYCWAPVFADLYHHAYSGLAQSDGGEQPDTMGACEVKGALLGSVVRTDEKIHVIINAALPLPFNMHDRNDRCSFGPVDDDVIRRWLKDKPLAVVGYYHSHPDHPIFLSLFDVQTLNRRCLQEWTLAVVIQPREGKVGFFVKEWGEGGIVFSSKQKPTATIDLYEYL